MTGAALTGCRTGGGKAQHDKKVLWMGDSITGAEAPPLQAALKASGMEFKDTSSDGGGTVVEGDKMSKPLAEEMWKDLRKPSSPSPRHDRLPDHHLRPGGEPDPSQRLICPVRVTSTGVVY
ncbi:hypothetical protein ACFY2W_34085 [Streptomyces sp. NPDC001262]|uniref:hypothetical protein n=1 Tax=Streptomyces sp. NPDC001262 TaxID=3364552 RepID=UPI0036A4C013